MKYGTSLETLVDFTFFFIPPALHAAPRKDKHQRNGPSPPYRPPASLPDPQHTSGVGGLPLPPYPVFLHSRSSVLSLPLPRPMLHSRGEPLACLPGPWATHPIAEPPRALARSPSIFTRLSCLGGRERRGESSSSCARRSGYWLEGSRWIWSPGWTDC